jgi:cytochrome c553
VAVLCRARWAGFAAALAALPAGAQELCAACHGAGGNSLAPAVPSIAGQPRTFLETQLILFREGVRPSEQMGPVVKGMKDAEISRLAAHFEKLPAKAMESAPGDASLLKRGRERAAALGCGSCHRPDYAGQSQIPRLAAQREQYLVSEMLAYRDNKRQGGDTIMAAALYGVSDADIRALAHYLARQP